MAKNFTCNVVTAWNGVSEPFDFEFPAIPKTHSWFYVKCSIYSFNKHRVSGKIPLIRITTVPV